MLTCSFCNKTYIKCANAQKHLLFCKIKHDQPPQNYNDVHAIIKQLVLKCESLEKEVRILKETVSRNHKINILEYLQHCTPTFYFGDKNNIIQYCDENALHITFDNGLYDTILHVMKRIYPVEKADTLPVRCFTHKRYIVYIYDESKVWREMRESDIVDFVRICHNQLIRLFQTWRQQNEDKINNDIRFYEQVYVQRLHKVMNYSCKSRNIILKLYDHLKQLPPETITTM